MHETPEFVQLAFQDRQLLPERKHDQATVTGGTMEPIAGSVFVDLNDASGAAEGIFFG
jgi:hypothetical protein